MSIQEFFTARELAEIAKDAGQNIPFPKSKRGVNMLIEREGWDNQPGNLARKRPGRGGAMEYNFSLLPGEMQSAIRDRDVRVHLLAKHELQAAKDLEIVQMRPSMSLTARQATVRDKRAQVLRAIDDYSARIGSTRRKAIMAFLDAQSEWAKHTVLQEKVGRSEPLSPAEQIRLETEPTLTSLEGFALTEDVLILANDRPKGNAKVGRSTLYDWFKLRTEHGVEGLAPAATKVDEPVSEAFKAFLRFYAKPMKPSATDALAAYLKTDPPEHLRINIDQVRRTLKVKLNDIEKNVGREGLLTLRSRMAYITRFTDENFLPGTVYVADGKTFDAEIADWKTHRPMKPELTSIIDVATRKCVGYAISRKENTIAVTEALRNACVADGIPAIFYTDRGAGYKNKKMDGDVAGLMGRLSITKMHALPYNSQAKGNIERFNRTVWNPLAQSLPTYLGKDMDKEAKGLIHKQTRSDIIEFGQSSILPSWDEFRALCDQAIADYNQRPHSGLPKIADRQTGRMRHMSPMEAWEAHVAEGFEPVTVDDDIQDDLFRPYEIRTARRALIEWNSNTYYHADLEAYHGKKVMVGYDDTQARYVWIREIDRASGQPGKFICKADFTGNKQRYVPLTAQRKAEEERAKGRMRRIDNKVLDIAAELDGTPMLEHQPTVPLEIQPSHDLAPEPLRLVEAAAGEAQQPARRIFSSDEELASWALDHPTEVSPRQLAVLKRCLVQQTSHDVLRMSGIDMEALANLLRAAA